MQKITILIVDDHQLVRDGIRSMLESRQEKKYKFLVDEAQSGEEAIGMSAQKKYDLIIMDYQMPKLNGMQTTEAIISKQPDAKILALSNYDEHTYITDILKAGAKGYVLKNIGPEELVRAIETILSGKNYYCNDAALKLIVSEKPICQILKPREKEILKLIVNEYTNDEIGKKLFLSRRTIDKYRQSLLRKLQAKNTAGLVKQAIVLKIVE